MNDRAGALTWPDAIDDGARRGRFRQGQVTGDADRIPGEFS